MGQGGYDGSLRFDTRVDTGGFNRGLKSVNAGLTGMTTGFKRLGAAVGAAFGFVALSKLGKVAIDTASDLQEVQNVVDTAFGSMAYKAEAFAKTAIDKFGMSELAAKKTASTFMAMAKSMGLGSEASSNMAIDVAGLTGDVASFYNITQDLASVKLKAIWTGETEGLKDLGVVMTQTNLQAFAMAQGITKSITEMTQAEQVTLRYQYVTEQLGLAQGDFAKTSGSWANQTRILSERFKELMGILGNGLMTALTPGLQLLNELVAKTTEFATTMAAALNAVFGVTSEEGKGSSEAIDGAVDSTEDLTDATNGAAKAAKNAVAGFDELNKLSSGKDAGTLPDGGLDTGGASGEKVLKIGVEIDTDEANDKLTEMLEGWKSAAEPTQEAIDRLVAALDPLKTFVAQGAQDFYENFLKPLGVWVLGDGLPRFFDITSGLAAAINWDGLNDSLDRLWQVLEPLAENVGEGLLWFYENVLGPMAAWAVGDLTPAALDLIAAALGALGDLVEAARPSLDWLWQNLLVPLGAWSGALVIEAIEWLTERLTEFSNWARENPDAFAEISSIVLGFLAGLLVYDTVKFLSNVIDGVGRFATALFGIAGSAAFAQVAFGLLFGAAALVVSAWDDMSGVERAIAVIALLAGGCIAAAIAVGALQSAWSLGVAAAAIVAGVVAITAIIRSSEQEAKAAQAGMAQGAERRLDGAGKRSMGVPHLASGAVIPPNAEFLAVLGDQTSGRNVEAPEGLLRQIVGEEMSRRQVGEGKTEVSVHFTGSLAQLGRVLKPVVEIEQRRVGPSAVRGGR